MAYKTPGNRLMEQFCGSWSGPVRRCNAQDQEDAYQWRSIISLGRTEAVALLAATLGVAAGLVRFELMTDLGECRVCRTADWRGRDPLGDSLSCAAKNGEPLGRQGALST